MGEGHRRLITWQDHHHHILRGLHHQAGVALQAHCHLEPGRLSIVGLLHTCRHMRGLPCRLSMADHLLMGADHPLMVLQVTGSGRARGKVHQDFLRLGHRQGRHQPLVLPHHPHQHRQSQLQVLRQMRQMVPLQKGKATGGDDTDEEEARRAKKVAKAKAVSGDGGSDPKSTRGRRQKCPCQMHLQMTCSLQQRQRRQWKPQKPWKELSKRNESADNTGLKRRRRRVANGNTEGEKEIRAREGKLLLLIQSMLLQRMALQRNDNA